MRALIVAGGAMYAPYGPFFAIVPEMLPKNVAGEVRSEKKVEKPRGGNLVSTTAAAEVGS